MKRIRVIPEPPSTLCLALVQDLDHSIFDGGWLNDGGAMCPDRFALDQSHGALVRYGVQADRIELAVQSLQAGAQVIEVIEVILGNGQRPDHDS